MEISIIEWIVYGIPAYSGIILLVISAFRETPDGKSQSIVRAMYLMLSIICAFILAGSGVDIHLADSITTTNATSIYEVLDNTNAIVVLNSTVMETVAKTETFTLLNPIWILIHWMFAAVMLIYVTLQILILFTKI